MTTTGPTSTWPRPVVLEYVTTHGCSDCAAFETLLAKVTADQPGIEVREVTADAPRGIELSLGRGILRFPVIVIDDEVIAVERITESELRAALSRTPAGA